MIPCDLDDADAALFTRLANDPRVIVPTSDLGEDFEDALASLESSGFVKTYEWEGGFAASLTPLGATGAKLRVDPTPDADGAYRWEPADAPERPDRLKRRITPGVAPLDLDAVVDRRLHEPVDTIAAEEEIATIVRRSSPTRPPLKTRLVPPRVLLEGVRPWVNPEFLPGEPCRACKGLPLGDRVYCLLCYRWGLDDVLARFWAAERARAKAAPRKPAPKFRPRRARIKLHLSPVPA